MRRLAFAIVVALVAGPAAAQPADDAIGQLLSVPPPATEPAAAPAAPPAVPDSSVGLAAPATSAAPTTPAAPAPAAAPSETVSTAAPAASPAAPTPAVAAAALPSPAVTAPATEPAAPSALAAAPAPVTSPATSAAAISSPAAVEPPASQPALAASAPPQATTAASSVVSPAQAAALQAAVMSTPPAPPGPPTPAATKGPPAPTPAYSTLSSVIRPAGAEVASSLAGPAPAGDAEEDNASAPQPDSAYANWPNASESAGARPAYGRYRLSRPTYGTANPGLPFTRYSQVTRPVQLAETGVSADQPMTPQDLAYEGRMRQAFAAAENAQGPMDGHWVLIGPEGRLYGFQVVDRGQTLEGVWSDLRRPPGSLETAGLIEQLSRDGDSLTVRFTAPRSGGPVTLTLRSAPGGTWAGQMTGASSQVTLRRD